MKGLKRFQNVPTAISPPNEPEVQTMSNFDFATIDSSRPASLKQMFAISTRFTPLAAETLGVSGVKVNKILRPRITAVIQSMEPNHGMIQKWFKVKTLPKKILDLIETDGLTEDSEAPAKPKASKKVKTSPKPSPKASEEPEAPKQAIKSDVVWKTTSKADELSQRLTILEAMQSQTSEDVQSIKSAMESLVASLGGLNS